MTGRNTLSLESVKAQKVVLSGIRAAGGAHLVSIFAKLLSSMKMAHSKKVAVAKEKAEAKRKAAAGEQAAKKRQEEQEAEQRNRDEKKLEDNIRELQEEIKNDYRKLHGCCEQRLKEPADSSILQNAALSSLLTDFTTNLYIQIVYTIRKFCTLLKKIVHYTILFEQE